MEIENINKKCTARVYDLTFEPGGVTKKKKSKKRKEIETDSKRVNGGNFKRITKNVPESVFNHN